VDRRRVSGYAPGEVREYECRVDPRVKVWIRQPTELEKRRAVCTGEVVRFDQDGNPNDPAMVDLERLIARQERFVRGFVEKVAGYEGAGGAAVETGDDLAEHGEADIVADVALEIEHSLTLKAEERKKSDAPPAS
jgi:hypothetical protein